MIKFSWNKIPRPIICLAPIAGYTDSAFRQTVKSICRHVVVWTELISADSIKFSQAVRYMHKNKTLALLKFKKIEQPIIVQLFGKNIEYFSEAAKYAESIGASGIDINMGCPAKKVVRSMHGAALLKNKYLALRIAEKTAASISIPVSVKTRLGFLRKSGLISFGKSLENAGVKLITVHGRTYKQGFSGKADFQPIYELKKNLNIPVIGNGDIKSFADFKKKIKNLDGVMIGRAAIGNPWVLKEIFERKKINISFKQKIPFIIKHARLAFYEKGAHGIIEMRKHLIAYTKGLPQAKRLRKKIVRTTSIENIKKCLTALDSEKSRMTNIIG